jgi:hypothetical protein
MENGTGRKALIGTFGVADNTIHFVELDVVGKEGREFLIVDDEDDNRITPLSEIDAPDTFEVAAVLAVGELVTRESKSELEERLRMRLARWNIC